MLKNDSKRKRKLKLFEVNCWMDALRHEKSLKKNPEQDLPLYTSDKHFNQLQLSSLLLNMLAMSFEYEKARVESTGACSFIIRQNQVYERCKIIFCVDLTSQISK